MKLSSTMSAIVTGGASGLGLACVRQLVAKGVPVVMSIWPMSKGRQHNCKRKLARKSNISAPMFVTLNKYRRLSTPPNNLLRCAL